ncbi:MAG: hypothetical protein LBT12_01255 [Oscillospiraceae bacterium]|nr:hypothetical protein [Oscillospiraceae bacterium]
MIFLRGCCRPCGLILTGAGLIILTALLLPAVCWWFFIGVALLLAGYSILRKYHR